MSHLAFSQKYQIWQTTNNSLNVLDILRISLQKALYMKPTFLEIPPGHVSG